MTPTFIEQADILDLIDESIVMVGLDGRILYWNRASEQLYGWPRQQALGRVLHELLDLPEQDHSALQAALSQHGRWQGERRRYTSSGDILVIDVRLSVNHDHNGEPRHIVEVGRDVTERNRFQQTLQHSEYRYRNLFNAMAASFWELDFTAVGHMLKQLKVQGVTNLPRYLNEHPDVVRNMMRATRVIDVNERGVQQFGRGNKTELLQSVEPFWPESSTAIFAASVLAAVSGQRSYLAETRLRTLGGEELNVLFTASFPPESVARGELLIGVIDITERTRAQQQLLKVQADFAHAARVSILGELTASIAHEVNQPLAAITTNGEAGLRWLNRPEPDVNEVRQLTQRIVADARRAADIINRIRSLALRKEPERHALRVTTVIDDALMFLRHELQSHQVEVQLHALADAPLIHADRTQLQQVLVNLLVNAVQAMHQATVRAPCLKVSCTAAAERITISVEDNGPGIDPSMMDKMFDSFTSTKADGMGLGLAICRNIIESHGGNISVNNSHALGGAQFQIILPTQTENPSSVPAAPS